jgi:hypothetical protein
LNAEARRTQRSAESKSLRLFAASAPLRFASSVLIRVHPWLKTKTPPPVRQWGSLNLWHESEPDRRAAQQQRVRKQQVQVHVHAHNLISPSAAVNGIRASAPPERPGWLKIAQPFMAGNNATKN